MSHTHRNQSLLGSASHAVLGVLAATALSASFVSASLAATPTNALAETAQAALQAQMGTAAKDITVVVDNGVAKLGGWAQQPGDVRKASYIVSQVPGVTQSYSSAVHTWTATDRL